MAIASEGVSVVSAKEKDRNAAVIGLRASYDVVKQFESNGESIRGDRTINEAEATVVRRIFSDYLAGKSSRTIAFDLNR